MNHPFPRNMPAKPTTPIYAKERGGCLALPLFHGSPDDHFIPQASTRRRLMAQKQPWRVISEPPFTRQCSYASAVTCRFVAASQPERYRKGRRYAEQQAGSAVFQRCAPGVSQAGYGVTESGERRTRPEQCRRKRRIRRPAFAHGARLALCRFPSTVYA